MPFTAAQLDQLSQAFIDHYELVSTTLETIEANDPPLTSDFRSSILNKKAQLEDQNANAYVLINTNDQGGRLKWSVGRTDEDQKQALQRFNYDEKGGLTDTVAIKFSEQQGFQIARLNNTLENFVQEWRVPSEEEFAEMDALLKELGQDIQSQNVTKMSLHDKHKNDLGTIEIKRPSPTLSSAENIQELALQLSKKWEETNTFIKTKNSVFPGDGVGQQTSEGRTWVVVKRAHLVNQNAKSHLWSIGQGSDGPRYLSGTIPDESGQDKEIKVSLNDQNNGASSNGASSIEISYYDAGQKKWVVDLEQPTEHVLQQIKRVFVDQVGADLASGDPIEVKGYRDIHERIYSFVTNHRYLPAPDSPPLHTAYEVPVYYSSPAYRSVSPSPAVLDQQPKGIPLSF